MMPTTFSSEIKEIAFKTVPLASKTEIKHVLESFYSLQVQKVRTLNVKGKTKNRGGNLVTKPNYKKVYVTLKKPISFDVFPFHTTAIDDNNENNNKILPNHW